jgi:hypothetical protein
VQHATRTREAHAAAPTRASLKRRTPVASLVRSETDCGLSGRSCSLARAALIIDLRSRAQVCGSRTIGAAARCSVGELEDGEIGMPQTLRLIGRLCYGLALVGSKNPRWAISRRWLATAAAVVVCAGLFHTQWTAAARGSTVFINCLPGGGGLSPAPFQAKGHPRICDIQGQPENLGTLIPLRDAHWTSWGSSSAEAVGRQQNKHPGQGGSSSYPVHIRLYRIGRGCHGHLFYTRAAYGITSYGPYILRISPSCKSIPQPL